MFRINYETMMSDEIRSMPKHERMKLPRQSMPIQDAEARGRNYDEVALGYRDETALLEARHCLQCQRPKCAAAGIDRFLRGETVTEGEAEAVAAAS